MEKRYYIALGNRRVGARIMEAASEGCTGIMEYRKWNRDFTSSTVKKYTVMPLSCGITTAGNYVMYAEDFGDGHQVKRFLVSSIVSFESTGEKRKPRFPIDLDSLSTMFGSAPKKKEKNLVETNESTDNSGEGKVASKNRKNTIFARKLLKIAQDIMEFSGAEAHLYCENRKEDSYNVVDDDGR